MVLTGTRDLLDSLSGNASWPDKHSIVGNMGDVDKGEDNVTKWGHST